MGVPWRGVMLAWAAFAAFVPSSCTDAGTDSSAQSKAAKQAAALVERLREPGTVLLIRHLEPNSRPDGVADLGECDGHHLTATAKRQARLIKSGLTDLGLKTKTVWSSAFCRARETGALTMTGTTFASRAMLPPKLLAKARTESDPADYDLRGFVSDGTRVPQLTALISHASSIRSATGLSLAHGETLVIIGAKRSSGFRVVARLMPRDWQRLASR